MRTNSTPPQTSTSKSWRCSILKSFRPGQVHDLVWLIRQQCQLPLVKGGGKEPNPFQWVEGIYSVQGTGKAVGLTVVTVYRWGRKARMPPANQKAVPEMRADLSADRFLSEYYVRHERCTNRSKMEAV